jgi:MFS family permease
MLSDQVRSGPAVGRAEAIGARPDPLYRNRRFQALWAGGAGAMLASSVVTVASPLLVLAIMGSPAAAGLYGFANAAAVLAAGLPAGVLLDRFDRRTLLIGAEVVRGAAFGSAAFALAVGHLGVFHLFAVAVVTGGVQPVSNGARALATRAVVPQAQLTRALTQQQVRNHTSSIIGPPLAGILYALSRSLPFAVAVLGFLVSAACALAVPHDREGSRARRARQRAGVLDGVKILIEDPVLRSYLAVIALFNLAAVALDLVVVVLIRARGGSPATVGLVFSAAAVGGLAGAGLIGPLHRLLEPGWLLAALCGWSAVLAAALIVPLGAWWYAISMALSMLGVPAAVVLLDVLIFRRVDDARRGGVISSTTTIMTVGLTLGPLQAGLLLQYVGTTVSILAISGIFALTALLAVGNRAVRTARWPRTAAAI